MPELPEVEVVRQGLQATALGRTVTAITVRDHRLRWPVPGQLGVWLAGRRLAGLQRRGKYLLLDFETGWLIVHLGMSGTIRYLPRPVPLQMHDHVDIVFEQGLLRYNDPRRFGAILWHPRDAGDIESHALLAGLGVEPFSAGFDGALLYRASRGRKVSVKQFLLAGAAVVGVGNIYCSESLFRAGIRPTIGAGRISAARYDLLADAIRRTLSEAIERGGSSLRDFVGSDGQSGYFQLDALVYGRAQQPCRTCGAPIRMVRQQQRASFYCASCQR